MGRWGYTMFAGDTDADMAGDIEAKIGASMHDEPDKIKEAREKLDAGLGAKLMKEWRAKENSEMWAMQYMNDGKYLICVLAAVMMSMGAKISQNDRHHIKAILPGLRSIVGYVWPLGDEAFRQPGEAQFTAAFENYVDGQLRSFFVPSCYNCGKIADDLDGRQLKRCTRCVKNGNVSYFCDQECQEANWKDHKPICQPPRSMMGGMAMSMNV